jgi:hypothetical protein
VVDISVLWRIAAPIINLLAAVRGALGHLTGLGWICSLTRPFGLVIDFVVSQTRPWNSARNVRATCGLGFSVLGMSLPKYWWTQPKTFGLVLTCLLAMKAYYLHVFLEPSELVRNFWFYVGFNVYIWIKASKAFSDSIHNYWPGFGSVFYKKSFYSHVLPKPLDSARNFRTTFGLAFSSSGLRLPKQLRIRSKTIGLVGAFLTKSYIDCFIRFRSGIPLIVTAAAATFILPVLSKTSGGDRTTAPCLRTR